MLLCIQTLIFEEQKMKYTVYSIVAICFVISSVCPAAPKPAIVQDQGNWTVEVKFEHPLRDVIVLP